MREDEVWDPEAGDQGGTTSEYSDSDQEDLDSAECPPTDQCSNPEYQDLVDSMMNGEWRDTGGQECPPPQPPQLVSESGWTLGMGRSWDGRNRLLKVRCKRSAPEEEENKEVDLEGAASCSKIRRLAHSGRNWRIRMGGREESLSASAGTGSPVESGNREDSEFGTKTCHLSGNKSQPERRSPFRDWIEDDQRTQSSLLLTKQEAEPKMKP